MRYTACIQMVSKYNRVLYDMGGTHESYIGRLRKQRKRPTMALTPLLLIHHWLAAATTVLV